MKFYLEIDNPSEFSDLNNLLQFKEIKKIMATVTEIKTATADLLAKVNADDALIASIAADVAAIKAALDAAIANGADPAVLQGISDDLAAVNVSLDRQTAAEQAVDASAKV